MNYAEVAKHNNQSSCWVVLYGNVWDVTSFLPNHPGGSQIILKLAGKDATSEYDPVHPPGTLEDSLPPSANLGKIDATTLPTEEQTPSDGIAEDKNIVPELNELLNLNEIEELATRTISKKAWAYYYSAGDDLVSKTLNNTAWRTILMRPRIFVDCTRCDVSTKIAGYKVKVPFFVSPAALARLAHPEGEKGIADACGVFGAAQIISNNASMTPEQIVADAKEGQVFGWQLYVQSSRKKSETMLARINALPAIKFIVLTLDVPVSGKREHDERMKNVASNLPIRSGMVEESDAATGVGSKPSGGIGATLFAGTATDLTWSTTLPWLAQHTKLPIFLKGVQTHEDAYLASLYPQHIRGIILSNHGGRALDTAPPAAHTLLEIHKYCPEVFSKVEVLVDGGVQRGTDIVKALCLGAKAVGLGRAPLWGLGIGGSKGVERVLQILQAEVETCMRLLGVEKVQDLGLKHINTRALERDVYDGPANFEKLGLWVQAKRAKL